MRENGCVFLLARFGGLSLVGAFDVESRAFVEGRSFGILPLEDGEFVIDVDERFSEEWAEISLDSS